MHMEFVTVGKASSDKIHVKYNDSNISWRNRNRLFFGAC